MFSNQKPFLLIKNITDLLILILAFIFAGSLAQSYELLFSDIKLLPLLLILMVSWIIQAKNIQLYNDFNSKQLRVFFIKVLRIVFIQASISVVYIFAVKELLFTRYFIFYYSIIVFFGVSVKSILLRKVFKLLKKKKVNEKKLLVIGDEDSVKGVLDELLNNPELGYYLYGYMNSSSNSIGNVENLSKILESESIDSVILELTNHNSSIVNKILRICDNAAVDVFIIPEFANVLPNKFQITTLADKPILSVRSNPQNELQNKLLKRTFDILFSLIIVLFILSWLYPILALLIKRNSKGDVLFIQERIGKDNNYFKCYKFRTMTSDASNQSHSNKPVVKTDKRVTELGRFLRKYNLDEMPQFLNVLSGSMSIVGPRPHAIPFNNLYSEFVEEIKLRHRVKPGITGWAQIHGLRGDVEDMEENRNRTKKRIEYDVWYIENWTIWLDIQIVFETAYQIVFNKNQGF